MKPVQKGEQPHPLDVVTKGFGQRRILVEPLEKFLVSEDPKWGCLKLIPDSYNSKIFSKGLYESTDRTVGNHLTHKPSVT